LKKHKEKLYFDAPYYSAYDFNKMKFSTLCRDENSGRLIYDSMRSCRELLASDFSTYVNVHHSAPPFTPLGVGVQRKKKPFLKRMKLGLHHQPTKTQRAQREKDFENWVINGTKFINKVEKYLGWSLTKTTKAVTVGDPDNRITYCLSASAKWQKAPQLISLYLLFMRMGYLNGPLEAIDEFSNKSLREAHKEMVSIVNRAKAKEKTGYLFLAKTKYDQQTDNAHFGRVRCRLMQVLDNVDALFFHSSLKENYKNFHYSHGIYEFMYGRAKGAPAAVKALERLRAKEK
jgi:hypothetical protein